MDAISAHDSSSILSDASRLPVPMLPFVRMQTLGNSFVAFLVF